MAQESSDDRTERLPSETILAQGLVSAYPDGAGANILQSFRSYQVVFRTDQQVSKKIYGQQGLEKREPTLASVR